MTGGSAMLPSVRDHAHKVFGMPVQVVKPLEIPALYDHPAYTACWGIIHYAAKTKVDAAPDNGWRKVFRKLKVFR